MSMIRRRTRPVDSQHGRLRIRRRVPPLAALFPFVRWIATIALVAGVAFGATQFFGHPSSVGALQFTPHTVGQDKSAVGVKGVKVADMTGNGVLDIVTVGEDGVKIYSSGDTENWSVTKIDSVAGERVEIADFNKDGKQDILVTLRNTAPSVKWYRNQGNKSFVGAYIGAGEAGVAAAGDIDNDGDVDIVTATRESNEVVLRRWVNNGSGVFASTIMTDSSSGDAATNTGIKALGIANVNCGAYADIVTAGEKSANYWTTSDGATWSAVDVPNGTSGGTDLALGDFDQDSRSDIVVADRIGRSVALYRNLDCQEFEKIDVDADVDVGTVLMEDLNKDGAVDILLTSPDDDSVFWYDHDGSRNFTKRTLADSVQNAFGLALADITGNDEWDFVAGDQVRGTVYWYERLRARPRASAPTNIRQTTDGSGRIIFEVTVSDTDSDATSARVQYSVNGDHWYKPWLTKVTADNGTVDLKNSNGYQIGTSNAIDTDDNETVTLTIVWDTKSNENTGGPIKGDVNTVQVRLIPKDDLSIGPAAVSSKFRVDNEAPSNVSGLIISAIDQTEATLSWNRPQDNSAFTYAMYYGVDHTAVLERRSSVWTEDNSEEMGKSSTTRTTITDLQPDSTYTFKLFATDTFGNRSDAPSVTGGTFESTSTPDNPSTPSDPGSDPGTDPDDPGSDPSDPSDPGSDPDDPVVDPDDPFVFPTPTPTSTPPDSDDPIFNPDEPVGPNRPPAANAGESILVNPTALLILDGTGSADPDGNTLSYSWQQIDGPPVELKSPRTATPSFTAGSDGEVYIFALTVQDPEGEISTDMVTIGVKPLSEVEDDVVATTRPVPGAGEPIGEEEESFFLSSMLQVVNLLFFVLSIIATIISLLERFVHSWGRKNTFKPIVLSSGKDTPTGKVVHYKTGEPIADVQVFVYGADKKLRATERTNNKGEFATLFPAGEYSIDVKSDEFTFAPTVSGIMQPDSGILYTGGSLEVKDGGKPLNIIIPMKPTGKEVSSSRTSILHNWQAIQHMGRIFSWPLFLIGALINTVLVFLEPAALYLIIEVFYVILVIVKISMEVNMRPAYGLVRDAITHVPLDLAVVRLFEHGTNRLVMTRVTNAQGKFFALPPAGKYTITITKPGYAVFSKQNLEIAGQQDSTLQITADLMPVAPQKGGLQAARAAVL